MNCKRIKINKDKCISCGACIATSPNKAIDFDKNNKAEVNPKIVKEDDEIVIDVCPVDAIYLEEFDEEKKEYKK